jgi:uncharacterized protein
MNRSIKVLIGASIFAIAGLGSAIAGSDASRESEAARTYYRAAVQGSAEAQANLGALYAAGNGVQQSDAAAFQWLKRAAEQGHGKAQLMLGEIWANGAGVPKNDLFAYKWAYLAEVNATDSETRNKAASLLDRLARGMSNAQIVDARQRATEWRAEIETSPTVEPEPASKPAAASKSAAAPPRAAKKVHTERQSERRAERAPRAPQASSFGRHVRPHIMRFARKWGW